jgi:hypothetical protein
LSGQEGGGGLDRWSQRGPFYSGACGDTDGMDQRRFGACQRLVQQSGDVHVSTEAGVGTSVRTARQKCQWAASAAAWLRRGARGLYGHGCPHEMCHGGIHAEVWLDSSRGRAQRDVADGGAKMRGRQREGSGSARVASMLRWTGQALSGSWCPGHLGSAAAVAS